MKKQTAVEWLLSQMKLNTIFDKEDIKLFEKAKEMEKEHHNSISAFWDKLREKTKEVSLHIGFAAGFESALKCQEDFYKQLDETNIPEDVFTRDYITDRFEETYGDSGK